MYILSFFFSMYIYVMYFEKKLIPLLSLEFMMILVIMIYFFFFDFNKLSSFSVSVIFLIFMVLDSVLGLVMMINFSRLSEKHFLNFY